MDKKKIAKTSLIAVSAAAVAGLAFVTPSLAASSSHKAPTTVSSFSQGKSGSHTNSGQGAAGDHGPQGFGQEVSQNVTVTVPDDGATYELVVTQTGTPAVTNSTTSNSQGMPGPRDRSIVVAITGTGSVTVSVPGLHPGTYKADLVKVTSSQDVTVAASTTAAGTAAKK